MQDRPHPRRLTRSTNRRLGGVCGGLADYFGIDATLVRVTFVVLAIVSLGFGAVLLYGVLWAIMPEPDPDAPPAPAAEPSSRTMLLGFVLIVFGVALLLQRLQLLWWLHWGLGWFSWPLLLLLAGVLIVLSARRR
ncbi:MAG: PspC domain-containing protein [Dehalococcoidia bacterium]